MWKLYLVVVCRLWSVQYSAPHMTTVTLVSCRYVFLIITQSIVCMCLLHGCIQEDWWWFGWWKMILVMFRSCMFRSCSLNSSRPLVLHFQTLFLSIPPLQAKSVPSLASMSAGMMSFSDLFTIQIFIAFVLGIIYHCGSTGTDQRSNIFVLQSK